MVTPTIRKLSESSGKAVFSVTGQNSYETAGTPDTGQVTATKTESGNWIFPIVGSGLSNLGINEKEMFATKDFWPFGSDRMTSSVMAIAVVDKDGKPVAYLGGRLNNNADTLTVDKIQYVGSDDVYPLGGRIPIKMKTEQGIDGKHYIFDAQQADQANDVAVVNAVTYGVYTPPVNQSIVAKLPEKNSCIPDNGCWTEVDGLPERAPATPKSAKHIVVSAVESHNR